LLLFVGREPASALTAGELLAQCEQLSWMIRGKDVEININHDPSSMFDAGKCWGFLNAYFDLALNTESPNAPLTNPLHACPPNGISFTLMIKMFLDEARNNPDALHQDAFFTISNVLMRNFPCK
jgi:hypothetical protein